MEIELVKPEAVTGPVAPLVERVRAMILADKIGFESAMIEIRARIDAEIASFVKSVESRQVVDASSYAADGEDGKRATTYIRRVEELLDPVKEDFFRPYKHTTAIMSALIDPLKRLRDRIVARMTTWDRAEKERVRREREEAERQAAEEHRRAEDERIKAAEVLQEAGLEEAAEEMIERPVEVTPEPVRPTEAPKIAGVVIKQNWQWECTSLQDLVLAVAEGKVPLDAVIPNGSVIGKAAKKMKDKLNWPSIRVWDAGSAAFGK